MTQRPTVAAHRRLAILVSLCFTLTSAWSLAAPAATFAWDENAYSSASEHDLVALTNQSRAAAGRKSLKVSSTLTSIARWRSKDMIKRDFFSHSIPGVGKVFAVMDDKGYCYHLAGENIGWNNNPDDEATAAIHRAFMDSSGHRANILNKSWDVVGIGAYQGSDGKKMWTVLFADRAGCGSSGPKATPKPTAKPKPKPKPEAEATPRPTRKPKPSPEAAASEAPRTPSAEPSIEPTEPAEPFSFPPPEALPDDLASDEPDLDDTDDIDDVDGDDATDDIDDADTDAGADADDADASVDRGLRVVAQDESPGLIDAIVGGVTGFFIGG